MPSGTDCFTGRAKFLTSLHERLSANADVGLTQAISGLGGVGKTSVAIRYAEEYGSHYCRVFWLNAASADTLNAAFREFLENVLELSAEKMDVETVRANVKAFFTEARRWPDPRPWLIIFDNVEDIRAMRPFVPRAPQGCCLFTSRLRDLHPLTSEPALSLDVFEPAESFAFLKTFSERSPDGDADETAAKGLADDLGHLPLALEQAAAYIRKMQGRVSFAGYRKKYADEPLPYLNRHDPEFYDRKDPDGYLWTVAKTWNINFAALADQPVAQLLRCLAFVAPDRIPLEIFRPIPRFSGRPSTRLCKRWEPMKRSGSICCSPPSTFPSCAIPTANPTPTPERFPMQRNKTF